VSIQLPVIWRHRYRTRRSSVDGCKSKSYRHHHQQQATAAEWHHHRQSVVHRTRSTSQQLMPSHTQARVDAWWWLAPARLTDATHRMSDQLINTASIPTSLERRQIPIYRMIYRGFTSVMNCQFILFAHLTYVLSLPVQHGLQSMHLSPSSCLALPSLSNGNLW